MLKKIKVFATAAAGALLALPLPAYAVTPPPGVPDSVEVIINNVVTLAIGLAGAVAILFLIIGGYSYVTSGGDKMKLQDAQGKITASVMGLAIVLVSYLMINVICTRVFGHSCVVVPF